MTNEIETEPSVAIQLKPAYLVSEPKETTKEYPSQETPIATPGDTVHDCDCCKVEITTDDDPAKLNTDTPLASQTSRLRVNKQDSSGALSEPEWTHQPETAGLHQTTVPGHFRKPKIYKGKVAEKSFNKRGRENQKLDRLRSNILSACAILGLNSP